MLVPESLESLLGPCSPGIAHLAPGLGVDGRKRADLRYRATFAISAAMVRGAVVTASVPVTEDGMTESGRMTVTAGQYTRAVGPPTWAVLGPQAAVLVEGDVDTVAEALAAALMYGVLPHQEDNAWAWPVDLPAAPSPLLPFLDMFYAARRQAGAAS